MNSQAPTHDGTGPSAASNTNTSSKNKTSLALLDDPIFKAIHNAFLLGWSLMELKSRVQITACTLSLNPDLVIDALKNQPASTQPGSQPQSQDDQNNPPDSIDSLLENVVLKDVIAWKDVQGKLAQSNRPISQEKSLATELRDNVWLTSVLRAIFTQITMLHVKRFPGSDVTNTIYDIRPPSEPASLPRPDPQDDKQPATDQQDDQGSQNASDQQKVQKPFPYLYLYHPDPVFDYANVGIRKIEKKDVGNNNIDIDSFLKNFRLYDITRRALNCLGLLLTTSADCLMPETIAAYQQEVVQRVLAPPPTLAESDSSNQKPANQKPGTGSNGAQSSNNQADQDNRKKEAIKKLSNLVIPLLEAWDSFLRESFYVDTNTQNNDSNSQGFEIELVAYEAGRSLAALSWGVSVALVPLEKISLPPTQHNNDNNKDVQAGNDPNALIREILNTKAQNTWMNVFNDRDVNHVQHQIAALSTALDVAYFSIRKDLKPPSADDLLVPLNPDLPSQAIQAVTHSLNYWEQAIAHMCEKKRPLREPLSAKTQAGTPVLAPPTTINTSNQLADGTPRPSRPLDWEMSKTLRTELTQQSTVWQSLILYQQGLRSFTVKTVTQKILNDFMQDLEKAAGNEIFNNGAFKWTLWIIGIIFVLLVLTVLGLYFVLGASKFNLMSIISSPPVIITAIVTTIGATTTPFINALLSRLSKIGSFFGSAGTSIEKALQDGYAQILIEFDYLNHNVGVTFPLIEFFVWEEMKFGDKPIEDGYDFLVNVFWTAEDREEEIQRVARAAFGPIGAFVGSSLKLGDNGSQKTSPPSKNGSKQPVLQGKTQVLTGGPKRSK
jgi:hypothetical protein